MSANDSVWMVYVTVATMDEAEKMAELLVTNKVAACVNILGEIQSIYEWNGSLQRSKEVALIAKTTSTRFSALEKMVKDHHSYECPCIVAWPLASGHGPFLDWVKQQTL